jgi:hypothetical protein
MLVLYFKQASVTVEGVLFHSVFHVFQQILYLFFLSPHIRTPTLIVAVFVIERVTSNFKHYNRALTARCPRMRVLNPEPILNTNVFSSDVTVWSAALWDRKIRYFGIIGNRIIWSVKVENEEDRE